MPPDMETITTTRHDDTQYTQPGWAVECVNGETTIRKYFSDRLYGSREESKRHADEFADNIRNGAPFMKKPFLCGAAT